MSNRKKHFACVAFAVLLLFVIADAVGQEPPEPSSKGASNLPQRAIEALKVIPDDATLDQKILSDGADKVLATCGDATVSVLKELFAKSDSLPLRRKILLVVRKLGLNDGPQLFIEALRSGKNDDEKELALDFLRDNPSDEAIRRIALTTVGSGSASLTSKAQRVFSSVPKSLRGQVVKVLEDMARTRGATPDAVLGRRAAIIALGRIPGPEVSGFLYRQLDSLDDEVRVEAIKALRKRDIPTTVEKLTHMALSDPSPSVRREAVRVVAMIADESAVPDLIEVLQYEDDSVRGSTLQALKRLTGQSFGPQKGLWDLWWKQRNDQINQLLDTLNDESGDDVLLRSITSLSRERLNRREIAAAIEPFLVHDSRNVRHAAIRALGNLGQEASVPALLEALDTNDGVALAAAFEALGQMKHDKEKIVAAVGEFVSDYDGKVAAAACATLGSLGSRAAIPTLLEAVNDLEGKPLVAAMQAIGKIGTDSDEVCAALVSLIDHDDPTIAAEACAVLGQLRNRKAIPALIDALPDRRGAVAHAAYKSLKTITSKNLPENHDDWMAWWKEEESAADRP